MSFDQFEKLFQGISDDQVIEYKLVQPSTGEILTKTGTKADIRDLKDRGYNVYVDKSLANQSSGHTNTNSLGGGALNKVLNGVMDDITKASKEKLSSGSPGRNMMTDGTGWNMALGAKDGEENDRVKQFRDQVVGNTKNALVAVGSGSMDVIKSTAVNAYQSAIHAVFAAAGFCVIAGTTYVLNKTVKMLPGAAGGAAKIINQLVASTGETVKQITASVAEAAEEASARATERAAVKEDDPSAEKDVKEEVLEDESK